MNSPDKTLSTNPSQIKRSWFWHLVALGTYSITGAVFIDHGESLTRKIAGQGTDPFLFIWFLAWWPWAIAHHLDLLFSNLIWQPEGVYLGWVTSVPLLAVIGWPLTLISPVLTYNVLIIAGPILAAWTAYFLCLHIGRQPKLAMIGGFLFGFSSYEMTQDNSALNLSFTMCVPLLLLIILNRLDGTLNRRRLVLFGGLTLICQFLVSIEIFGMIFVIGGVAWGLAVVYLSAQRRALLRLLVDAVWTSPFVVLALSPLLFSMMRHANYLNLPSFWPYYFVADPLNFIVPSPNNLLGGLLHVTMLYNNEIYNEQDSYIGLPLLLLIAVFARDNVKLPVAKVLLLIFLLLLVVSLGPRLLLAGQPYLAALPWSGLVNLPLVGSALPTRFALFVSLLASIIAVLWMAGALTPWQRSFRQAMGVLACIFLLPQLHPWMGLPESQFFQPGRVQAVLGQNARVLVLPFSIKGPSPFWHAQSKFGFVQTGGYLGFPPRQMQRYPAVHELFGGFEGPHFLADVTQFCMATHTQFIVVGPGTAAPVMAAISQLKWPARKVDDVILYAVPVDTSDVN